jgi:hypothetical protein
MWSKAPLLAAAALRSTCSASGTRAEGAAGDMVWTLYRSALMNDGSRVHVATFDASDTDRIYNQTNCEIVRDAMAPKGPAVRYWCEQGRYRK